MDKLNIWKSISHFLHSYSTNIRHHVEQVTSILLLKYPTSHFPTSLTPFDRPHYSYYDKHYRMSPALIRARQPFLIKNIITGLGLFSITVGICQSSSITTTTTTTSSSSSFSSLLLNPCHKPSAPFGTHIIYTHKLERSRKLTSGEYIDIWTIKAIGQDDFSDLDMPDPPPRKSVTASVSYPDTGSGDGGVGKNTTG